jgi:hypothetical protein
MGDEEMKTFQMIKGKIKESIHSYRKVRFLFLHVLRPIFLSYYLAAKVVGSSTIKKLFATKSIKNKYKHNEF